MSKPAFKLTDAFALLLLCIASAIGINQYAYGIYNHCITVPFVKSLFNPELYPGDYVIGEIKYFYSLFVPLCALLVKAFKFSFPVTFFIFYLLTLYATLISFFLLSMRLFPKRETAYFATMLLAFSFTTLGEERTVENLIMERTLALPFMLFSFNVFFAGSYKTSALLAGIAFLFHPLSASYGMTMMGACLIYKLVKDKKAKNFLVWLFIIVAVASPVFIMKIRHPAPGLELIKVNREWLELLRLRSAHHLFPSGWSKWEILEAMAFIAGFLFVMKSKSRQDYHTLVVISFVTILILFLFGTIFTEVFPISVVIQFQLFRSFKFIAFFAIIYYANFLFTEPNTVSGISRKMFATGLLLAPYLRESLPVLGGALLLCLSTIFGLWLMEKKQRNWQHFLIAGQLAMLLLLGIAGSKHDVDFTILNAQGKNWVDIQDWARNHTSLDAAFITPPYMEGFRVESDRAIYGEWKDGTQMFFDPSFGHEWMRRMKMLGYKEDKPLKDAYKELKEMDFVKVAKEMTTIHSSIFVVAANEHMLGFQKMYSNKKFSVYQIPAAL